MGSEDRRSYDTAASGEVQTNIQNVIAQLEGVITARDQQVKAAMSDFQADGVSDQYHGIEQRWNSSAQEVRAIITLLRTTMEDNDATAQATQSRAQTAVNNIA